MASAIASANKPMTSFVPLLMVEGFAVIMLLSIRSSLIQGMAATILIPQARQQPLLLPELSGRVAVLGGSGAEKSQLLIALALRHVRQQRTVLCLDGRRQKQTEVQFRLLLRGLQSYIALPPSSEVPKEITQMALRVMSRGLPVQPPLLLLDAVPETSAWEQTLAFLLKAGVLIVELLVDASRLVFGRYDTVLLLRSEKDEAEASSKAVGRRVTAAEIHTLPPGKGILLHLAQVWRVALPEVRAS
jgi:hypothetical protein